MQEIGNWLHRYRYFGPCGADILETVTTDAQGHKSSRFQIMDLNVRTSASLVLGFMKGHFSQRDCYEASSFDLKVSMKRQSFAQKFENHFQEGRIVICAWFEEDGMSCGNVIVGARDELELERQVAMVKDVASEVQS